MRARTRARERAHGLTTHQRYGSCRELQLIRESARKAWAAVGARARGEIIHPLRLVATRLCTAARASTASAGDNGDTLVCKSCAMATYYFIKKVKCVKAAVVALAYEEI